MLKYILKRIGYMVLTLWIIATLTFALVNAVPGDPINNQAKQLPESTYKAIRAKYHLDDPITTRYFDYLKDLLHGNMGESIKYPGKTVNEMIAQELPVSAKLGIQVVIVGLVIGITMGVIAAFYRNRWPDYLVIFIALIGSAIPGFVLALLLQFFLGGKMGLPTAGWYSTGGWFSNLKYTILPTIALAVAQIASNARFMRSSVLDVINQDYILTAKSKGVKKVSVIMKHILRNASIPVVTILGPRIASIITGTLIVEQMYAIPGLGRELFNAINNRDYTVIMSLTVFFAFLYIVSLLVVDIAYVLIDPKIKLASAKK
ncbi:ABC transporter permease [Clostridium sp. 19966]|uniref:ABC transporter permease n=1 Tax=Clostridium sp. 19966 TaxID=2768166 RepID=UPI0028DFED33|nr:ABC transporter permease [Clostridium sp. 19966]MDT8716539.1 ABC transporter permease [Clostridium sp. 19966]